MMKLKRSTLAGFLVLAAAAGCGGDSGEPTGNKQSEGQVFTYRRPASAPAVTSVHLAGSFNDWSTTARPMTQQADGTWRVSFPLAKGSYQYKYVMNGSQWVQNMCNDPTWGDPTLNGKVAAHVATCMDDGFGGQNAVLVVP